MKSTFHLSVLLSAFSYAYQLQAQSNVWDRIDKKANWFLDGNDVVTDAENITKEFQDFYDQFISDSTFQIEHIKFPLTGAIGFCESTREFKLASNWKMIKHHYSQSFSDSRYSHLIVSTSSLFFLRSTLNDVGVISQIGFEKIGKKWFLTLFMVNVC